MYIVVNGGGKVGSFLAKTLKGRGHDVAVIERHEQTCREIASELPDILVVHGDGCNIPAQKEAGTGHADVFASVTGDDDDNLVACQLAKASFNVPRAIARVNNPKNEHIFHKMGIDAISSTTVISHLVEEEATIGDVITLYTLKKGKLALLEVELPTERCKVCHKRVSELSLPRDCIIVVVLRGEEVILPRGETVLEAGDSVIALASVGEEEELKRLFVG